MKRLSKIILTVVLALVTCVFPNDASAQTVSADLSQGLWAYIGNSDPFSDDASKYVQSYDLSQGNQVSMVFLYVDDQKEATYAYFNDLSFSDGGDGLDISSNKEFIFIKGNVTKDYVVTYKDTSYQISLSCKRGFTNIEADLSEGLWAYIGSADPYRDDISKYVQAMDLPMYRMQQFGFMYCNGNHGVMNLYKDDLKITDNGLGLDYITNNEFIGFKGNVVKDYDIVYTRDSVDYTFKLKILEAQEEEMGPVGLYRKVGDDQYEPLRTLFLFDKNEPIYVKANDENIVDIQLDKIECQHGETVGDVDASKYSYNNGVLNFDFDTLSGYVIDFTFKRNGVSDRHRIMIDSTTIQTRIDKYSFGLADNDDHDLVALPGYLFYRSFDEDFTSVGYLVGGELSSEGIGAETIAPKEMMDKICNIKVEAINNTFNEGDFSVSVDTTQKYSVFGLNCYQITSNIKKDAAGYVDIKITFDLDGETYSTYYSYKLLPAEKVYIDVTPQDMEDFNDIFESYQSFCEHYNVEDGTNYIELHLPEGSYDGIYEINFGDYNSDGSNQLFIYGYSDNEGNLKTTINGTVKVESGRVHLFDTNFVAKGDVLITDEFTGVSDKTVGVYGSMAGNQSASIALGNCTFKNYDYGCLSTPKGGAETIYNSIFNNCEVCVLADGQGSYFGSGGPNLNGNYFINTKRIAVYIKTTTPQSRPWSLRINENYFLNDSVDNYTDIKIGENGELYHCEMNYYGNSTDFNNINHGHARPVIVDYSGNTDSIVYTNPCISYPGTHFPLGIYDPVNEYTCIFSGVETLINKGDLNKFSKLSINVSSSDGKDTIGKIIFD